MPSATAIAAETTTAQQGNDALKQQVGDLRATLASLTAEHEQAAKAVADANAERDRIAAETATAQQSGDALKQQVAQLSDQIAGRKTEQAGLDKEVDYLQATLAGLTAEHEQAAKTVGDGNAERDRIAAENHHSPAGQ